MYSVYDAEFRKFGRILEGFDTAELDASLREYPMPDEGTVYVASEPELEKLAVFADIEKRAYGGMPVQLGSCCGKNKKLNCLEYHRDSELNYFTDDVILMLGKLEDIVDGKFDSSNITLFRAPAGVLIELYATTLHYCPANIGENGFRAACALPRGTNTEMSPVEIKCAEDEMLYMRNKWIIAHRDAPEAVQGIKVGITGENTAV